MTDSEVAEFEEEPYFRQAVQLRRWDDQAKIEDFEVPSLTTYIPHLESLVFASAADQRTRL
jgi:[1-hydroxy-2-(trimethylamino)ethyl]phosphonate dioxygenase